VGIVLTVTPIASEAIRRLVETSPAPDSGGMRIAPGEETPAGTPLELSLVDAPEAEDETVSDGEGATVYLEHEVAGFLDDKVLDAEVDAGKVTFVIRDDTEPEPVSAYDPTQPNGGGPAI
jgi:Fe-S cluster assembly iron-binding protein IscA